MADDLQRSSDVVEDKGANAILIAIVGAVLLLIGGLLLYYESMFRMLGWLFLLAGVACIGYMFMVMRSVKQVGASDIICPFCHAKNVFTDVPRTDQTCSECHRAMPIIDGKVLKVSQVRCGFCNTLNYYSEKSVGLICEDCDREIPIAVVNPSQQISAAAKKFATKDDNKLYDIVLTSAGPKHEEVIGYLQHLLALNRNQVKDIVDSAPSILLTGIPRLKAELLQKDMAKLNATVEFSETTTA
jgi:ribosomal protein L7/L12